MEKATKFDLEKYREYKQFIELCRVKEYDKSLVLHSHHIIPKHLHSNLGEVNKKNNLIKLSVEDHITAHLMLAECYEENTYEYISNLRSARLLNAKSVISTDKMERISKTYLGENNPFFGKTHSKESLEKMSKSLSEILKGVTYEERYGERADEEKKKRSESVKRHWESMTEEEKRKRSKKISKSLKGKLAGSNNPSAKEVIIEDVYYPTLSHAEKELGMSRYKIKKYLNVEIINKK